MPFCVGEILTYSIMGKFDTGWLARGWRYVRRFGPRAGEPVLIFPDGSRGLEPEPGALITESEAARAGGELRYDVALGDLVNTKTGEVHRWPPIADCQKTFIDLGPRRKNGPRWFLVQCAGKKPDPLCGKQFPER